MRLSYKDFSEGYTFPEGYIEVSVAAHPICGITVSRDPRGTVYFRMEEKNIPQPRTVQGTVFDAEKRPLKEIQDYIIHNNEWFQVPEDLIKYGNPVNWRSAIRA
jgi:hypothetical protein